MITTPDLIDTLSRDLPPVRRLKAPIIRALAWLLLASVIVALLASVQGLRPDLAARLQEPGFATGLAAAIGTGILAAIAAFLLSLPDRSRLWALLPLPTLALWLANIGYQCLTDWVALGPDGISAGEAVTCFATLALTSLPLSLVLLAMLRRAAPLRPRAVAIVGSLSIAAITATALSLFHTIDATAMILMWNCGTTALFVLLGGALSGRLLGWPRLAPARARS